jgi:hypothetical protein
VFPGLQLPEDVDGRDLRLERDVPGDQDDRAELAHGPRKGERDAGKDRRQQVREDDPPEDLERAGPERGRCLLHLLVELEQHRLYRADDERQRHEQQREQDADPRERDVEPERPAGPVEREQRQPGDDRRQCKRQVDHGVDEPFAPEAVADEHPCDRRACNGVHERAGGGEPERQLQSRYRLGRGRLMPELGRPLRT